jgi:hypothetical protein
VSPRPGSQGRAAVVGGGAAWQREAGPGGARRVGRARPRSWSSAASSGNRRRRVALAGAASGPVPALPRPRPSRAAGIAQLTESSPARSRPCWVSRGSWAPGAWTSSGRCWVRCFRVPGALTRASLPQCAAFRVHPPVFGAHCAVPSVHCPMAPNVHCTSS